MHSEENFCPHLNEIVDHSGGAIVCIDCGLVVSNVFVSNFEFYEPKHEDEYILEILSRLQMPEFFKNDILLNLEKIPMKQRKKDNAKAFAIYKTLNELNCGIAIKDICSVTGFTDSEIYNYQSSNESIIFDPTIQLEKYCILLGLPKDSHSVIKEMINFNKTGHNPTTLLATAIYKYCKKNHCDISLEKISKTLNISSVSIKRYIKYRKNEP